MSGYDRRRFLEDSMFAAAAAVALNYESAQAADKKPKEKVGSKSPSERLNCAVIGAGGRSGSHIGAWTNRNDTPITWICDVDTEQAAKKAAEIAKKQGFEPKIETDLRKILEDKELNYVSIATPNHWHSLGAIWAIQAGKDVYLEKPISHNVSEGRRVVEAARKYDKIVQTGTQSRTMKGSRDAIDYIKAGKIGTMNLARGLCYKPRGSIGPKGVYEVPKSVNYDMWCGPAPLSPLTRPKLHYDWHWVWDTGNGDLGNQGIHQMDVCRWGLGVNELCKNVFSYGARVGYEDAGETANTQNCFFDYGDKSLVFEVRGLKTDSFMGSKVGCIFHGSDGYVVTTSYVASVAFDAKGNQVAEFKGGENDEHFYNFIDAVRSRKYQDLNADVLEGHLSSALCHLGNISLLLGEKIPAADVKSRLAGADATPTYERFMQHLADNNIAPSTPIHCGPNLPLDPKTEKFVNNSQADAMLTRDYRAPYIVPAAGQV